MGDRRVDEWEGGLSVSEWVGVTVSYFFITTLNYPSHCLVKLSLFHLNTNRRFLFGKNSGQLTSYLFVGHEMRFYKMHFYGRL